MCDLFETINLIADGQMIYPEGLSTAMSAGGLAEGLRAAKILSKGGRGAPLKLKPKMESRMRSYLSFKWPCNTSSASKKGILRLSSCLTRP